MNPFILNMVISSIKTQTEDEAKIHKPNNDWGELVSISFLMQKTGVIQRMKFQNHEGDKSLTPEGIKKLESSLQVDIQKEMDGENIFQKPCDSGFVKINIEPQYIHVQYNFTDGTSELINL